MMMKNADGRCMRSQKTFLVRATISSPPDLYKTLVVLAKQKDVSLPRPFFQMQD
jgi:hypothetical protein